MNDDILIGTQVGDEEVKYLSESLKHNSSLVHLGIGSTQRLQVY